MDIQTSYDPSGAVTTQTQAPAPILPKDDLRPFFRDLALRSLDAQAKPAVNVAPPPQTSLFGANPVGNGSASGVTQVPNDRLARDRAETDQRERTLYAKKLRDFDLHGPQKKNMFGWGPVLGGTVEDEDSIPYSLRGAKTFSNSPESATSGRMLNGAAGTANLANFQSASERARLQRMGG